MTLNYIWIGFFLIAFVVALVKLIFFGDLEVFKNIVDALFDRAKIGFELSLGLVGVMTLWLGIMKIGEKGGVIQILSRWLSPFFTKLFPEIPKNHPAIGSMMMNMSANVLGLDNAATPLGLKAMKELQEINPQPDTASNAQIMFLVLNASSLTLIPVSVLALRATSGSVNPTDIFVPILIATFFSTLTGLIITATIQKINLINKTVLLYLGTATLMILGLIFYIQSLPMEQVSVFTNLLTNIILLGVIVTFITVALFKKVNVYDAFIEGAKGGFEVAVTIIPYLVAMLVAIGVFNASGAMEWLMQGLRNFFEMFNMDTRFVEGLPTALMKPLSGGGARGLMVDSWGEGCKLVDSFVGHLTSIIQGSTETTFYVIAVYFGSVNIKKTRYAAIAGLIADLAGVIAAIWVTYLFFGGLS
jgi:spore maturation protein SpmA